MKQAANRYDFNGQHAVVTGGASGIGLAIAGLLLSCGAKVSLWDRDDQALQAALGQLASDAAGGVEVDVADEQSVARAAERSRAARGPISVLVNSAGIAGPTVPVLEFPVEGWDRVMAVNLRGPYLCCRAVAGEMVEAGYGRIVSIASIAGKEGNPNASAYSASKAGVIALTKSLGKELARSGVTVNCITPAVIRTPILEQTTQAHIDYMVAKIPMGRVGETGEVAALVAWLASRDCSFTTGAVFDISGGRATY